MYKILIICLLLASCEYNSPRNNKEAIEWINNAKKPIFCKKHTTSMYDWAIDYTLISSDGKIYRTGDINLQLPDTIN